jgi:UDP-N-acetylmuramyl pentapeptide phosphotransferase/UDP-N-acetylglucosamine-1-phosphate transferase
MPIFAAAGSAAACAGLILLMLRSKAADRLLDEPNMRSLHIRPVPRIGGLGILAGVAVGFAIAGWGSMLVLLTLILGCVGALDDRLNLPIRGRLAAQLAVAVVFAATALPASGWLAWCMLAVATVWMMNLYNFMDGSDGLAGGMAVIGFGSFSIAAFWAMQSGLGTVALCVASAAGAFLLFNVHPARIFMGDAGSVPLGFLAAALGVIGWRDGVWPIWFPVLVFMPFILDATVTLLRRIVGGKRFWLAHREHYYQRLVRMGFGHRNTALLEYAIMIGCGATALRVREATTRTQFLTLVGAVALLVCGGAWIDGRWKRFSTRAEDLVR